MTWLYILLFVLLSAAISGYIVYRVLRPRLVATKAQDLETQKENEKLQEINQQLKQQRDTLSKEKDTLIIQKDAALDQINNLNSSIQALESQAQQAADLFYSSKMQVAQEKLERTLIEEAIKVQENINSFKNQYDETVNGLMAEQRIISDNLAILRATNDAAIEAAKRAEEMKNQVNFYRIQLSDVDISEIELLRQVEPYLRDKEPLNKVIWKCYYEKPTTDLIGRVIGSGTHTGIYKITEIETSKCYVGQAANLADRWKQHIKRGVGAEAPTRNKLYPAMRAAGPENFTFEVIEQCDRSLLDEREKYWTDYFKAQEFGFSIRKG